MYRSKLYATDDKAVAEFVAGQRHGHLIATAPGGFPQVSILPFVKRGDEIELHCVQADETFAAVQANPRVTFFVSDFLAFSRHDWIDPKNAGRATLNFRAVSFECEATTSTDPDQVAATLRGLLSAYEPDATFEPLVNGDYYGPRLQRLAVVRLKVLRTEAKFKLGPADTVAVKRGVIGHLRERNDPGDARAADVIEASLPTAGYPHPGHLKSPTVIGGSPPFTPWSRRPRNRST